MAAPSASRFHVRNRQEAAPCAQVAPASPAPPPAPLAVVAGPPPCPDRRMRKRTASACLASPVSPTSNWVGFGGCFPFKIRCLNEHNRPEWRSVTCLQSVLFWGSGHLLVMRKKVKKLHRGQLHCLNQHWRLESVSCKCKG